MDKVFGMVGDWDGTDATLPASRIANGELKWEDLQFNSLDEFDEDEQKVLAALALNMPYLAFNGRFGFVGRQAHIIHDAPYNSTKVEHLPRQLPEVFDGRVAWGKSLFGG